MGSLPNNITGNVTHPLPLSLPEKILRLVTTREETPPDVLWLLRAMRSFSREGVGLWLGNITGHVTPNNITC